MPSAEDLTGRLQRSRQIGVDPDARRREVPPRALPEKEPPTPPPPTSRPVAHDSFATFVWILLGLSLLAQPAVVVWRLWAP